LYQSDQHAFRVADGDIGKKLNEKMLAQDVRILGYMATGFRNVFSNKPIKNIADLRGVKIRLMENPIQVTAFGALGAIPTTMAYSEVFTAIQQGTIDAAESGLKNIIDVKFHEVAKNVSKTQHFYLLKPICISSVKWSRLPEEYQKIIQNAVGEAINWQREDTIKSNEQAEKDLETFGVTIYRDFNFDEMSGMVESVYKNNTDYLPLDIINQIRVLGGN
jgi:TRAP-type C4-dicarboxylate transport system substrate-binding protein